MVKNLQKLFALVVFCCAFLGSSGYALGQVTLTSSPYTQNFDGIGATGTTYPTGWIGAKASGSSTTIENGQTLNMAVTNGGSNAGAVYNVGSVGEDDRALGSLASGSIVPRIGASFSNNTGATILDVNFSGVMEQWRTGSSSLVEKSIFEYSLNASDINDEDATWVALPSMDLVELLTSSATAAAADGNANLTDISGVIANIEWTSGATLVIRWTDSDVSGSDGILAIDNFKLDFTSANTTTPILIAPSTLNLGNGVMGATLTGSYTLSGRNLSEAITLAATSPIEISKAESNGYASSLTFTAQDLESDQTIYVRATATTASSITGTITHTSEGATAIVLNVSGSFASPYAQDFSNCGTTLPGGWTAQNVSGDQVWECTTFGKTNNAVQINGFSGGSKNNEDWLISPAMNLSGFSVPLLSFQSRSYFIGPALKVMISTNYDGSSAPASATWTELNITLPAVGSDVWTLSEALLDAYKQESVHVAFVYTSIEQATDGSSRWTLDDFKVTDEPFKLIIEDVSFDFGEIKPWSFSEARFYTFKGLGFTENIVITSDKAKIEDGYLDFEFSKDNKEFARSVSYTPAEAAAGGRLFIRFLPKSPYPNFKGIVKVTSGQDFEKPLGTLTGSSIPKSSTLDIVTWNVEWFGADKDSKGVILGPSDNALQYQNVKKAIEIMDADIYALQEIANDDLMTQLIGELPNYDFVKSNVYSYSLRSSGPSTIPPQKLYFVYKKSTVKLTKEKVLLESLYKDILSNTTSLPNYPGGNDDAFWASGRLPYMVEFEVNIEGITQRIHALNIHARANDGDNTQVVAQRRYDLQVLKDSLDAQYPNINLIMLGDYNDDVDLSVVGTNQPSTYKPFVDDPKYDVLTLALSEAITEGTYQQSSFLDHISVSSRLAKSYINESIRIEEGLYTAIPRYFTTTSDHGPVSARFFLSQTPVVNFSEASVTKTEGDAAFNVSLTVNTAQPVAQTVTISIADNVTANASDYTITGAEDGKLTVTIPANAKTASFEVNITDDSILELPEEVTFAISSTSDLIGIGKERNFKVVIQDNEKSVISFTTASLEVAESSGEHTVTLELDKPTLIEQTVKIAVQSGSATAADFSTTPASDENIISLVIPAGATTATFIVNVLDDAIVEKDETIAFVLSNPDAALAIGTVSTFTLTITDTDKSAVSFASSEQSVNEEVGIVTVTLNLSSPTAKAEQVVVNVTNGTGVVYGGEGDYTTSPALTTNTIIVNVPEGASTATFTVSIADDTQVENAETITFALGTLSDRLVAGEATAYALTITDNDKAVVNFAVTAKEVVEGSGEFTVNLELDQAVTTEQTISIAVNSSTATSSDYTTTPSANNNVINLTIPAGATSASMVVNVLEDNIVEANETVTFELTNPSAGLALGTADTFTLTITDNDKSTISFATTTQSVKEDAGTVTVTLNLSSPTVQAEQVVINVTNGRGITYGTQGDYTTNPEVANNTVTIAVPAGATTATFTVVVINDTEIEDPETITFAIGSLSNRLVAGENTSYALKVNGNDSPNGIADDTKGEFSVYPNPAGSGALIGLALPERVALQAKVNLVVYALDGRTALNVSGTVEQVQKQLNAKSTSLANGMYIVMVQAGKEYFQTKLIKQ